MTTSLKLIVAALLFIFSSTVAVYTQEIPSQPTDENSGVQTDPSPYKLEKGRNEFRIWAGAGPSFGKFTGLSRDESDGRAMAMIGLRYGRVLYSGNNFAFQYAVDAIPLVIASNNVVRRDTSPSTRSRETTYGAGFNPVGLKGIFKPRSRIKPFVGVNLGVLYFNKQFPVPDSSRLNFNSELDGGIMIFNRSRRAITLGAKFSHISNASTGNLNPGLNTVLFYAGYSTFR